MGERRRKGTSAAAAATAALLLSIGCSGDGEGPGVSPEPVFPTEGPTLEPSATAPDDPSSADDDRGFAPSDVTAPPSGLVARLSLDTEFYERHLDAMGMPVLSSAAVSPYALAEARWVIERMLDEREDIAATMARSPLRVAIMAVDEFTTDIPEHADRPPADWWDRRARGILSTGDRPAQSVGEENLLALDGDPYSTESIMVHEFAHAVHLFGMNALDAGFAARLDDVYARATEEGLWDGTYAAVNANEYFAEGVQSWFDTNRENDDLHGPVDTREELASHDPRLAALLGEVFGDNPWRYRRPQERKTGTAHLDGFDRDGASAFAWPPELASIDTSRQPLPEGVPRLENLVAEDWSAERTPGGGSAATTLIVVNESDTDVDVLWVDRSGERRPYKTVPAGGRHYQPTYVGHLWEVADPDGAVIGRYRAAVGDGIAAIGD